MGGRRRWPHDPLATFRLYPNLYHLFIPVPASDTTPLSTPADYNQPGHVAPEVIADAAAWIGNKAGAGFGEVNMNALPTLVLPFAVIVVLVGGHAPLAAAAHAARPLFRGHGAARFSRQRRRARDPRPLSRLQFALEPAGAGAGDRRCGARGRWP